MTRNIKALGTALAALLAIGALVASAAQAAGELEVHTDANGRANLTASRTNPEHGEHTIVFDGTTPSGKITTRCKVVTFEGTVSGGPANGKTTLSEYTVTPTYAECLTSGVTSHVRMNGCKYLFKGIGINRTAVGITGCTSMKAIEVEPTVFPGCVILMGEQAGVNEATFTNKGGAETHGMHATIAMNLIGFSYAESAGCPHPGGHADTEYKGNLTFKAFKDDGGASVTKHSHTYTELICGTQLGLTSK